MCATHPVPRSHMLLKPFLSMGLHHAPHTTNQLVSLKIPTKVIKYINRCMLPYHPSLPAISSSRHLSPLFCSSFRSSTPHTQINTIGSSQTLSNPSSKINPPIVWCRRRGTLHPDNADAQNDLCREPGILHPTNLAPSPYPILVTDLYTHPWLALSYTRRQPQFQSIGQEGDAMHCPPTFQPFFSPQQALDSLNLT